MTTTQQPESLVLADEAWNFDGEPYGTAKKANAAMMGLLQDCSTEIRRLHARAVELEQGLQYANSAFTGLQKCKDDWKWRALEAESQLEAIGAGGVESLRKKGA